MKLKEGLAFTTLSEFKSYLQRVNDCPFSTPCPVEDLKSKVDGHNICVECCKRYLELSSEEG